MRIGFATNDWAVRAPGVDGRPSYGGSGWARCGLPAQALRGLGFEVAEGTLAFSKEHGVFLVREWPKEGEEATFQIPDLVVLQRWMFASVAVEAETARGHGQVIVNDLDDHFWAIDPRNQAAAATDPKKNLIENRDYYAAVLRASSAVTCSTPYLAAVLRRELRVTCPIHVIPNHVDLSVYQAVYDANHARVASLSGRPRVGWVGATPWRSGDVETLRGVLGPFLRQEDVTGYHGGHLEGKDSFSDLADLGDVPMIVKPMVPIREYPSLMSGLDVGLVPLRDVAFNRAKSWIKGLEYAAGGVPFVAQDLPEYVRLHALGIGRVARRPRDWTRQMKALLDPAERLEEMESNRANVKAHDIAHGVTLWRDLYLDLIVNGA